MFLYQKMSSMDRNLLFLYQKMTKMDRTRITFYHFGSILGPFLSFLDTKKVNFGPCLTFFDTKT